jgi:hypothetical protein
MSTPAQAAASKANSRFSTGPKTAEGKAASRFNPLRHGLTSEHLIIPGENPEDFEHLLSEIRTAWAPANPDEESLVSKVAEHEWRMMRARRVETATLSIYVERLMNEPEVRGSHDRALALVYERFGKELDRLRRYETTISRALHKVQRELENLVASREAANVHILESEDLGPEEPLPGFVSQNGLSEPRIDGGSDVNSSVCDIGSSPRLCSLP